MNSTKILISISLAMLAGACARSSVLPVAADTVRITTSAAPICGGSGAQSVALRRAAIETINRGYDGFIIVGAAEANNVQLVGTGGTVRMSGNMATYTPNAPIVMGSHDQGLVVKMFKAGDPNGANAVSARATLGSNWQETVKQGTLTTCTDSQ